MGLTTGPCGEDDSQQQHPQQLSSPHAASSFAFYLAWTLTYKSIGSIAAHSTLSFICISILLLFFYKEFL
jgi:hypothetical protein